MASHLPTLDEARRDAVAAFAAFYVVVVQSRGGELQVPGLRLANALADTADRGLWAAHNMALACLVGLRSLHWAKPTEDFASFRVAMDDYVSAFQSAYGRVEEEIRAGGARQEAAEAYVESADDAAVRPWFDAFVMSDQTRDWERMIRDAIEPRRPNERFGFLGRTSS